MGSVELCQEANHILLTGSVVRIGLQTFLPHLRNGAVHPKAGNKIIGGRLQPKKLGIEWIVKDVPSLPAKKLAPNLYVGAKCGMLIRNSVPGVTVCAGGVGHLNPEIHAKEISRTVAQDPEKAAGAGLQ